ncbi:putative dna damage repair protein [Golovinomyces cichoracearum]|uniref:Putative dna damage repair protein n=1 Tax=Golovinomyces cichoracearum TaxID=62708 RepID=A0A420HB81_9PEZI|nr:putative dna damage repair protein [Golovinomyces cichoracearum]
MHRSAEEAVLLDHEQELDTQRCIALQRDLLSSSPFHTTQKNLVNILNVSSPSQKHIYEAGTFLRGKVLLHRKLIDNGDSDSQLPEIITKRCPTYFTTTNNSSQTEQSSSRKTIVPCPWKSSISIDGLTQKSSMSMTQENPVTAYAHLFSATIHDQPLSNSQDDNFTKITRNSSNQEHDTHSAKLISGLDKKDEIPDLSENSCAVPRFGMYNENQNPEMPQTPNLPSNPFKTKGSIMQKIELFAATQPSSINQRFASPTSSRPSPDAFNYLSSPTKLLKVNMSPLAGYTVESKILDFSGDNLACHLPEIRSNSKQNSFHELCPYTSINEFQERKNESLQSSTSKDLDSVSGSLTRLRPVHQDQRERFFREKKRESKHIYKYRKISLGSEKSHAKDPMISQENDCSISKDSNFHEPNKENIKVSTRSNELNEKSKIKLDKSIVHKSNEIRNKKYYDNDAPVQNIEKKDQVIVLCSNEKIEPQLPKLQTQPIHSPNPSEKQPSIPTPNEALRDQSPLMPIKKKTLSSDEVETVPETSPLVQQPFQMKEVAVVSSYEGEELAKDEAPGFAKDLENEDAMRIHSSQVSLQNRHVSNKSRYSPRKAQIHNDKSTSRSFSPPKKSGHITTAMDRDDSILSTERLKASNYVNHRSKFISVISHNLENYSIEDKAKSVSLDKNTSAKEKFSNKSNEDFNQKQLCPAKLATGSFLVHKPIIQSESTFKITNDLKHVSSSHSLNSKAEFETRAKADITYSTDLSLPTSEKSYSGFSLETNASTINKNSRSTSRRTQVCNSKTTSTKRKKKSDTTSNKSTTRKLIEVAGSVNAPSTRSSTRQSTVYTKKEDSEDPLSLDIAPAPPASLDSGLFSKMAFAVSFVKNDKEKNHVIQLISENGGLLLEHGFDSLFEPFSQNNSTFSNETLSLSTLGKSLNFAGVIADEYSRKTKYVQALALDLPCLSNRWIQACISKKKIIDWSPYLLCAGKSAVLGNACRSRILQPYSATNAELSHTFAQRKKIFQGKSVLLVMGRGRTHGKRKTFDFLTRALGPCRVGKVADLAEARKILSGSHADDHHGWDLLHVHDNEKNLALIQDSVLGNSRKQKFVSFDQDQHHSSMPNAKRIRIITDEIMIQSLIFGELIEERI